MKKLNHTIRRKWLLAALLALTGATVALPVTAKPAQRQATDTLTLPRDTVSRFSLRNNLLYDAALTPNLGFEWGLDRHWSIGGNVGFRPWPTDDTKEKKWKHLLIAPELRHWNDSIYKHKSSFWGLDLVWSHYNVAAVKFPFGMYKSVRDGRREGDLLMLGVFYGYNWRLSRYFRLEAEAGIGVGYAWGKEYDCGHCGTERGKYNDPFLVPKLGLNIVYNKMRPAQPLPIVLPDAPTPPALPVLAFGELVPATVSDLLKTNNPVLEEYANYRPYDRTRVLRKEPGMLYVHFPLDKTTLLYDFRDNGPILDNIVDITRQIMADSMSNVRLIQVIGLASVEGPIAHNEDLGNGRAKALADYIKKQVPEATDQLFELNGGGEAWAELRDQLNDYINDNNEDTERISELLKARDIVDNEPDLNKREQQLRRLNGGRTYNFIKNELLPDQRNSGYLRIYFDRVPDAKADAINQAIALMKREQWQPALNILNGVKEDPRSWNALGVTLFMNGQAQEALDYFRKAAANGNADARLNADRLSGYLNALSSYQTEFEKYNQLVNQQQLQQQRRK